MEFRHTPLERATDQIRLLRVVRFPNSGTPKRWPQLKFKSKSAHEELPVINCTLVNTDFHQRLEYFALSYNWGPLHPSRTIQVNGQTLSISENLWHFLYIAGQSPEIYTFPLWIDQICIDQSLIPERNQQVSLMGQIYQRASTVFIWLGAEGQNSDLAMKSLASGKVLAQVSIRSNWYDDKKGYPRITNASFWDATLSLLQRPYWCRQWIIQEVLLAKSLKIYCGRMTLPWDIFNQTIDRIYDGAAGRGWRLVQGLTSSDPLKALREIKHPETPYKDSNSSAYERVASKPQLSQLICSFRYSLCADPRDRVFGFMGLVDEDDKVEVDYSISPLHLFVNVLTKLYRPPPRGTFTSIYEEHVYTATYHREERYPGYFVQNLYRALVDPEFGVGENESVRVPKDGCRILCDIMDGSVRLITLLGWIEDPEWFLPSNVNSYKAFGQRFDIDAARPEFTCDSVLQMVQYILSFLPHQEEILSWWITDSSLLGYDQTKAISGLKMQRSRVGRKEWHFVDEDKRRGHYWYEPTGDGSTLKEIRPALPEWFSAAEYAAEDS